ncbi:hypothetical protein I317_00960 [Kwoniella heveanensis CBS 569]|nr:hypothetical protein I317_00960 [Kwoniella heveanensis CBS 569]
MASSSAPPKVKSTKSQPKSKSRSKQSSSSTTASASASTSGPKTKTKTNSNLKSKDAELERKPISAEFVDDEAEESDDDDNNSEGGVAAAAASADSSSDDSDSSSEEEDSEVDLEGIEPRRSSKKTTNPAQSLRASKTLSRYEPPVGMTELKATAAFVSSPFEWEALANKPGVELWAIRVPKDLKPSRLSALSLTVPRSSHPSSSYPSSSTNGSAGGEVKGSFTYKSTSYTLTPAGSSKRLKAHTVVDEEGRQPTAGPGAADSLTMDAGDEGELAVEGGEEMEGMRLLVPRVKQGGKLFVAPLPITRRLILTPDITPSSAQTETGINEDPTAAPAAVPSFLSNGSSTPIVPSSAPSANAKRPQPTHLFKFRNEAYGFNTPGPGPGSDAATTNDRNDGMDVDEVQVPEVPATSAAAVGEAGSAINGSKDKKEKKDKKDKKDKRRKSEIGTGADAGAEADVAVEDKDKSSPAKKKAKKSKA